MTNHTSNFPPGRDAGDPLDLFRNLPPLELSAQELADMKRSVHELRRTRALEAESPDRTAPRRADRPVAWNVAVRRRWARMSRPVLLATAAAFLLAASSLIVPSLVPSPAQVAQLPAPAAGPSLAELAAAEALPLVENVSGDPELIQIEDAEMSLVVVAAIP